MAVVTLVMVVMKLVVVVMIMVIMVAMVGSRDLLLDNPRLSLIHLALDCEGNDLQPEL